MVLYINHDLIQHDTIDLDIPLTTNCSCIKVDNYLIHFKGYLFENNNNCYTFNKWYNEQEFDNLNISTKYANLNVLSLVQWSNHYFQHIAFDTIPKLKMIKELLNTDDDIFILVNNDLQKKN